MIAWLVDAAAILSQKALLKCSYLPYRRVMQRICWEESFHILHGRDVILALMTGSDAQRELVQEALDRWWEPLMHFHGPDPADKDPRSPGGSRAARTRSCAGVPRRLRAAHLGARPDRARPALRHDEASGHWEYTEPDWERLRQIGRGHGPATQERLGFAACRRAGRLGAQGVRPPAA